MADLAAPRSRPGRGPINPQLLDEEQKVVTYRGEDGVVGITLAKTEVVARYAMLVLESAIYRLDGGAASSSRVRSAGFVPEEATAKVSTRLLAVVSTASAASCERRCRVSRRRHRQCCQSLPQFATPFSLDSYRTFCRLSGTTYRRHPDDPL